MSDGHTQFDIAAESFEALVKALDNAPYNPDVQEALDQLRTDLIDLGLDIRR